MLLKTTFDTPIQPKLIFTVHRLPKGVRSAKTRSLNEARVCLARELQIVDKFIVPSEACKDALTDLVTYAYPTEKVEVIRHGVNFQGLRSESPTTILEDLSVGQDDIVVFCPARLDQNKGINTLLAAAQEVLTQLPEKKLRFVIAGGEVKDSERNYLTEVMNMTVVRDHQDVFSFGKAPSQDLTHAEVLDLFRRAHICVLPSVWENFPVALLEASVFKKPIIASNVGGIKEIVEDGRTGLLVYQNSAQDLADAIVQLLSDKGRARRLATAAHDRAAAEFTVQRMAENHLRAYEEIAEIRVS